MIRQDLNDFLELQSLHRFAGPPREFWQAFLQLSVKLEDAAGGEVLLRQASEEQERWRRIGRIVGGDGSAIPETLARPLAEQAFQEGVAATSGPSEAARAAYLAVPLKTDEEGQEVALLLAFPGKSPDDLYTKAGRLLMLADAPALYARNRQLHQVSANLTAFASTLDMLVVLHSQRKFRQACMTVCNELAARFQAAEVAVGWMRGNYVRIVAVSNLDEVTRKMDVLQRLEAAMEESLDQDDEIVLPAPADGKLVTRDSEAFRTREDMGAMVTIPLRHGDEPAGAITLLRAEQAFDEREVRSLRVMADQITPVLEHIRRRDRWFGARWAEDGREALGKLWGVEHAWAKLGAVVGCILLAVLFLVQITFRVEAPFIVRTEMQSYLSAPFDGYIAEVFHEAGDAVSAGTVLARYDDSELRIQEASLLADIRRFRSEAERARSAGEFAQMRVSRAQEDQAIANLELTRLHLRSAEISAPFDGLIVEDNDLRRRIGAAVQRGDVLMRIARADLLYAEMRIKERDIDVVEDGAFGRIAFASRPEARFPVTVENIEPVAHAQQEGGVFLARGRPGTDPETWWRPGMTGVAKIDIGKRPIIWIWTHRLIDFLRMKLWI